MLALQQSRAGSYVFHVDRGAVVTFPLLRQQTPKRDGSPFLCLSDFIRPLSSGIPDTIGAFASSIDADMEGLYEQDPYKHLLVQTLSDRLAEAATEKMHEYVRKEAWGYAKEENLGIADLLVDSFDYHSWFPFYQCGQCTFIYYRWFSFQCNRVQYVECG